MKNLFLLNRLGFNPDLTTRQSRVDSVSIASRYRVLAILLLFFTIGSGNAWGATTTLAGWTFTSGTAGTNYPSNNTNFNATSGTMSANSTFCMNGSGSTWNSTKGYAFTSVSSVVITLKLNQKLAAGAQITLAADVYYNKAKNAPVTSYAITTKVGSAAASNTGVGTTSWSLSTSSTNKTSTYTTQAEIASGTTIQFILTASGSAGSGQAYFNNVTITSTTYTVTYNANSGTGTVPTDATAYCSKAIVTVKGNTGPVSRDGYTFGGWNTNTSGTGTNYTAGSGTFTITANTTLYAKWEAAASCGYAPTVSAGSLKGSVSSSSSATAQCTSGVSNIGGAGCSMTSYGFAVGTSENPTIGGTLTGTGKTYQKGTSIAASTGFELLIDGLSANTTYYVRPYATNGAGTGYGSQFSFTTLAACTAAPTVTAGSKGTITSTTAAVTCSSGISSLGTGGCSISSYGFAVGTSSNPTIGGTLTTGGKTYEVGQTYTTTGTSFNTSVTGLTEGTLYYVRPYATNGYNTGYGAQVSFGTPKITVSETSRAFGERAVGGSYTMTFTVSGTYLQSNISIAKSGTNQTMFSIDNATVTQTDGTAPTTTITVTYSPSTAGSHSATLTLTSTNATNKTVSLSGTGKWTVTFLNGNGGTHSTSLVANSTAPSKPGSNPAACDATSTTFIGWTQSAWSGKQNQSFIDGRTAANVKVYTSSDNLPAMTSDITYYPVFAKGSTTPSTSYAAITSGLETNKYVIAYSYNGGTQIVLKNTADGTNASTMLEGYNLSLSSSKYSNPDAAYIWELQAQADGSYYIYNTTIEKYVNATTTALTLSSTPTKFTITYDSSNSRWTIQLKDNTSYYVHGYVSGSAYDFRCTTSGSGAKYRVYLYKNESQTTYSDYLTTCCAKNVALSASATNGTVAFTVSSSPVTSIATCGGDKEVTMTITPAAGYKLTAYSSNTGTVSPSNTDPAVATSGASSKSAQEITLTFDENANGTCTIATTFTAMKDTYKDQLHGDVNTTFDGDGKEYSATYTVPNLTNPSKGSGDCESEHYKFVGWVESSYVKSDGTLNSGYTLYTAGSSGTASEKTYIAIWAKEL